MDDENRPIFSHFRGNNSLSEVFEIGQTAQAPVRRRRFVPALYAALALVFVAAVAYQVRTVEQAFPQWFGTTFVQWPFLLSAKPEPLFVLEFVQPNSRKAGLRDGDRLLAINGVPVNSRSIYSDILAASHPGDSLEVTYRRRADDPPRRARVSLVKFASDLTVFRVLTYAALPAFSLTLGFWVVAVRIQDIRGWLLLGLMLSIATFFNSFPDFWSPSLRVPASVYLTLQQRAWLGWLLLLGIYFPEPFPKALRWQWWKWMAWIVLPLWMMFSVAETVSFAMELHSVGAAMPINLFLARTQFLRQPLEGIMVAAFLGCIGFKYRIASSPDARRRLRVLYAGAAVSLLPVTVLFTIEGLKGVNEEYFPTWILMTVYMVFLLLPVTLSYVIVVQRAMDVRVVIRQGLQYTLARRGVLILQMLLSTALFIVLTMLMTSHRLKPGGTVAALGVGVWGIFLLHGATQRIAIWVDRRFFRDAYNAEQILSDLAEKVRTMIETKPLLETVAQRISDSLHVKQIAVLLDGSGRYSPAHALGYGMLPQLAFSPNAGTVQVLKSEKQPTRVYFDDPDSWIYKAPGMSNEERSQLKTLRSELLLPFSVKDDLLGFVSLGQKLSQAPYSSTDLRLLSSVAAQTGLALEVSRLNAAMGRELAARERLNRELEIAREVQEHLLPQHVPLISGLDYAGLCRPAREVGGDYYDFLELQEGTLAVAIGDVSGKGIGAALMMASLGASLRGQAGVVENLTELIERVNNLVYGASSANRYATFFYAEYNPRDRQLAYVNAGHNPPAILRRSSQSDGRVFRLDTGGPPIGLLPNTRYEQGAFALEPGDLVVLFTDGISESMNNEDEEWGEERLIGLAHTCFDLPAAEAMNRIMSAAQNFAGSAPQHDDMTVVFVRVLE